MNLISIRSPLAAMLLFTSASCVAFQDDEGYLSDEGCILDVRPKPKHPSEAKEGEHAEDYDKDHYVEILYGPGPGYSVDFIIKVAKAGGYVGIRNVVNQNDTTPLEVGENLIRLSFETNAVKLERWYDKKPKAKLANHSLDKEPMKGKIKLPTLQKLADMGDLQTMQINFEAFGRSTGFTILGKSLFKEPRWTLEDHPK